MPFSALCTFRMSIFRSTLGRLNFVFLRLPSRKRHKRLILCLLQKSENEKVTFRTAEFGSTLRAFSIEISCGIEKKKCEIQAPMVVRKKAIVYPPPRLPFFGTDTRTHRSCVELFQHAIMGLPLTGFFGAFFLGACGCGFFLDAK